MRTDRGLVTESKTNTFFAGSVQSLMLPITVFNNLFLKIEPAVFGDTVKSSLSRRVAETQGKPVLNPASPENQKSPYFLKLEKAFRTIVRLNLVYVFPCASAPPRDAWSCFCVLVETFLSGPLRSLSRRIVKFYKIMLAVGLIHALVLCGVAFAGNEAAAPPTYYSIHVASFQDLRNANAFVNSLQGQGKVVFWKGTQVAGKGYFYRIFTGRYASYAAAEKVWRQMNAKGQVSYKGIFSFVDILPQGKPSRLTGRRPEQAAADIQRSKSIQPGRFIDNGDGTVTDRHSGLMWIQNGWHRDFFAATTWEEAITKCEKFQAAGYGDWTLPTRAQWQSLLDDTIQAPAIAEPNPFKNVIIHMPYWAKDGPLRLLSRRYTTLLYAGTLNHQQKDEMAFVWPVRVVR